MSPPSTLADWLAHLEQAHPTEIELGLGRVRVVAKRLGLVAISPSVISVAGTNGKGSTIAMLEACASQLGLQCGSYTSPHIVDFNERIKINGQSLNDVAIVQAFEQIERQRHDVSLTYFEFTTLAALLYFSQRDLDIVFLEVGLGGRLDAVNIIDADLSIITSIAIDHESWLGNTRELIAIEKMGIARATKPLVVSDYDPPQSLLDTVNELAAKPYYIGRDFDITEADNNCQLHFADGLAFNCSKPVSLSGQSLISAVQSLALLGYDIQSLDFNQLAQTSLFGRFNRLQVGAKTLVFDVAHNVAAIERLSLRMQAEFADKQVSAFVGFMADKDYPALVQLLNPVVTNVWYLADLTLPRALRPKDLSQAIYQIEPEAHTQNLDFDAVLNALSDDEVLLICGSFYTVAHAFQSLQKIGLIQ